METMSKKIQFEAIMTRFSPLSGGGISIGFHSLKELTSDEMQVVLSMYNNTGWVGFKADEYQDADLPLADTTAGKTPSQRLRNTIFVLWNQLGKHGDFENFYKQTMESLINNVKEKLD